MKNYFDTSGGYVADDVYFPERRLSFEETIHEATLDILHKTGIKVLNTDAVALFHGADATVETFENHCIVKMSP